MLSIIAALLLTVQAGNTLPADAACIVDGLSAADRVATVAPFLEGRQPDAAPRQRVEEARDRCATGGGWTAGRRGNAVSLALGGLFRQQAGERLRQLSVRTETLDRWFARQEETIRIDPQLTPAVVASAFADVTDHRGEAPIAAGTGEALGIYLLGLVLEERARLGRAGAFME